MFRFRLAKVLKHRRRIVDQESRRLQEILIEMNGVLSRRNSYRSDIEVAARAAHRARGVHVDIAVEQAASAFVTGRRNMLVALAKEEEAVRRRVEAQRRVLLTAQRDVSVLEKLEEKQRAEYETEVRRRDRRAMDEVAGRRHLIGSAV